MELNSDDPRTCYPEVVKQSELLAKDIIAYRLGKNHKPPNTVAETLRKLADKIEEQYPALLNHLCHKLNFSRSTAYTTFVEIAGEVFADGVNWGRIVVLYAFGGRLAVYCEQHNMKDLVDLVTDWIAKYVAGLSEWIYNDGGWEGLNKQFRDKTNDSSWWKGVFITTLGIGTLAALVYTR
ncbi:bcl-2-like protein 1 [Actinia tenebrosa]|uniref:Bcl-2-like protein 1 n=1 Tax=Actinia tenebrosa TaxID=6105 RepID=A0A6P8HSD1_ACTTE|nr:bcl-2-like protein 1 [Actinia tenebrosa]